MNNWKFGNGIEVKEVEFNYDLHVFEVFHEEKKLGTIYPASLEDMNDCINSLNKGIDPISGRWEDGNGNACTLGGW